MNARFRSIRLLGSLAAAALVIWACGPAATAQPATPVPTVAATATAVPPTAVPTPAPTATAAPAATATAGQAAVKALEVQLAPTGLAFDAAGTLYIGQCNVETAVAIFKVDPAGLMTTVANADRVLEFSGDGGPALAARTGCPIGLAFDREGNLLFADGLGNSIRRIDSTGTIDSIAGTGELVVTTDLPFFHVEGAFSGDGGPASAAHLACPGELVFDGEGNLYFADRCNARIRKIDPQGIITTVAGNGEKGFGGDGGPATEATFNNEDGIGLAIDAEGNLYVADTFNARVRKIDQQGTITTIAGTGLQGFSGDSGPATEAKLNSPSGLAVDSEGNLYISSNWSTGLDMRIRKVDKNGIISTFAGTGQSGFSGDGAAATAATFTNAWKIVFDSTGNLYVIDDNRVRKIDTNGIITTVAGGGS